MLQSAEKPEGVILGVPPAVHGAPSLGLQLSCLQALGFSQHHTYAGSLDHPAKAMELDLAKAGLHMLIEKPISMQPAEEVQRLAQVISRRHALITWICKHPLCTASFSP